MTSNIGSHIIHDNFNTLEYDAIKTLLHNELLQHFKPEFLNRIDDTVVFHPLTEALIEQIAKIQLLQLQKRLKNQHFELSIDDDTLHFIAQIGYDPIFGARPLKRAIQNEIENPLAQKLLSGELLPHKEIHMRKKDNHIDFYVAE